MPSIRRLHLSLLIAGLAIAAVANARTPNEVTTEYFSDESRTVLVGENILTCGGGVHKWGKTTRFSKQTQDSCGKRTRMSDTRLAHLMLHHDPYLACTRRCDDAFPLDQCGENEACGQAKQECMLACQDLLRPEPAEDPAAAARPGAASAPEAKTQ